MKGSILLFMVSALFPFAAPGLGGISLQLDSILVSPSTPCARCVVDLGDFRSLFLYRGPSLDMDAFKIGMRSPFLSFGPLVPMGLIREIENPLGASAGAAVFTEPTGFRMDGSFDCARPFSAVLSPFPDRLGWFLTLGEGDWRMGAFCVLPVIPNLVLEGLAEFASTDERTGEGWYLAVPDFRSRRVAHASSRLLARFGVFSLTLSHSLSGCDSLMPGSLIDLDLSLGDEGLGCEVILCAATPEYVTSGGAGSAERLVSGGRFRLSRPVGSASVWCSLSFSREGFAPHPFLAGRECVGFVLERILRSSAGGDVRLRIRAENKASYDSMGKRKGSAEGGLSLAWPSGGGESAIGVDFTVDRVKLACTLRCGANAFSLECRAGARVSLQGIDSTAIVAFKVSLRRREILEVELGIKDLPLAEGTDFMRYLDFRLGWSARETLPISEPSSP